MLLLRAAGFGFLWLVSLSSAGGADAPASAAGGAPVVQPVLRSPYPPVSVPLIVVPGNPPLPPAGTPPPPVTIARPPVLTQCDATGCWDSNGMRLNRIGADLASPRGPCNVQGNIASCPP